MSRTFKFPLFFFCFPFMGLQPKGRVCHSQSQRHLWKFKCALCIYDTTPKPLRFGGWRNTLALLPGQNVACSRQVAWPFIFPVFVQHFCEHCVNSCFSEIIKPFVVFVPKITKQKAPAVSQKNEMTLHSQFSTYQSTWLLRVSRSLARV